MAEASHVDGILAVTLPKAPPAEAVRVEITAPSNNDDAADEDAQAYMLSLNAAGIAKADLELTILDDTLKVRGETKRTGARLARSYTIPRDVDAVRATATHVDGILTVTLPKKPTAESTVTRITVVSPRAREREGLAREGEEEKGTPLPVAKGADAMDEDEGVMI